MRRLQADHDDIVLGFEGHPHVAVSGIGPPPPDRYQVLYRVPAVVTTPDNRLELRHQHLVTIQLPAGYPREKPYCTCDSPVFHPNFGNYVCIADFWNPSQSVIDVIVQIGDMLQYKLFNTRSPLNAVAAKWAVEHLDRLPVGSLELFPIEPEVRLLGGQEGR
jgi:ubiquitin-protein ligase